MRCEHAFDDGAYVLGALSPAERDRYEEHLATCAECRETVASLAVLPGLLGRLSAADAQKPGTSEFVTEQRLPKLMQTVVQSRRRRKWRAAAAGLVAACVALIAGLAAGSAWQPVQPTPRWTMQMAAMRPVATTTVTAEIGLQEAPEGTAVTMRCVYPPPPSGKQTRPYIFRLVALGPDGVSEQVGSWIAGAGDEVVITGTVRLSLDDLTRLELRAKDGTALLAYDVP